MGDGKEAQNVQVQAEGMQRVGGAGARSPDAVEALPQAHGHARGARHRGRFSGSDLVGVLWCYGVIGTGKGGIGRRQWQDIANTERREVQVTGPPKPECDAPLFYGPGGPDWKPRGTRSSRCWPGFCGPDWNPDSHSIHPHLGGSLQTQTGIIEAWLLAPLQPCVECRPSHAEVV